MIQASRENAGAFAEVDRSWLEAAAISVGNGLQRLYAAESQAPFQVGFDHLQAATPVLEEITASKDYEGLHKQHLALLDLHLQTSSQLKRIQHAIGGAADGLWEWDVTAGRVWSSARLMEMLGYEPCEAVHDELFWVDVIHSDDMERVGEAIQAHVHQGAVYDLEFRVRNASGEHHWVRSRARMQYDSNSLPWRMSGSIQDIHQAYLNRQKLQSTRRTLHLALHAAELAPWQWNVKTNHVDYFPEWAVQLGHEPSELTGYYSEWESRLHPDDVEPTLARIDQYLKREIPKYDVIFRLRHKDGSYRHIRSFGLAEWDQDGKPLRMLGCHADITARVVAEQQRSTLEAQVRHQQKLESLATMASGAAHDFNNYLTVIQGSASLGKALLNRGGENPSLRDLLTEIEATAEQAADLTRQMLMFAGRGRFFVKWFRLDSHVRDMQPLLSQFLTRGAKLQLDLKQATVAGDETQVRQVVMNLVTNAVTALEGNPGVIRVSTSVQQFDKRSLQSTQLSDLVEGDYACLEVEDDGCGMTEETISRIFEPFFTTRGDGKGIGLAAVQGILRSLNGAIQVDSFPGRGSCFWVFLPAAAETVPEVDDIPEPGSFSLEADTHTVLLVDDNPNVLQTIESLLKENGVAILSAGDGSAGLEMYRLNQNRISAALLDVNLPESNGFDLLRRIHDIDPDLPVALMSGDANPMMLTELRESCADAFIEKPFQASILNDLIRRMIHSRHESRAT